MENICPSSLRTLKRRECRAPIFLLIAALMVGSLAIWLAPALAFPPAPDHLFYGLVRDEYGNPLNVAADIILETSAGVQVKGQVIPGLEPGVNYRLKVPMDAGLTSDLYKPTALRPTVPFKIWVRIDATTYLPIEMSGNYKQMGQPGGRTHLDLTLGEDSDGDGLPDAWERMLIAAAGGNLTLADINPNGDLDKDGLNNLAEYVAGTYAFDPEHGFALNIAGVNAGRPVLEFTAIRGRSYTVLGSADLKTWTPMSFHVPAEGAAAVSRQVYQATDVRMLRVEVDMPPGSPAAGFFKLVVE